MIYNDGTKVVTSCESLDGLMAEHLVRQGLQISVPIECKIKAAKATSNWLIGSTSFHLFLPAMIDDNRICYHFDLPFGLVSI